MSLISRLAGKRLASQLIRNEHIGLLSAVRPVTLKASASKAQITENHDERNLRLQRPLSPHLTIYDLQLTSVLSISHRITGMALSAYAIAFGLGAVVLPDSIPHYIEALQSAQIGAGAVSVIKFSLAFPLTFHFWNGIRHILWDTGRFLTIKEVYVTGYIMIALALGSAVALSVM